MKPQKLTILRGRRTSVDYDQRNDEYTEYNRTSKQVLLESDYVCAMCGDEATMTDHIISVKQDWSRRLDRNNLQASCKKCNDKKAIKERYSF